MTPTQPISQVAFSMSEGGKFRKLALQTHSKEALDAIVATERAINPFGPSKARCGGILGLVVCSSFILAAMFVPSLAPVALAYVLFLPVALLLVLYGGAETYNNMLVCADLRVRAVAMSFEQISVFKDSPQFKNCRDTKWFLGHLQEGKQLPAVLMGAPS